MPSPTEQSTEPQPGRQRKVLPTQKARQATVLGSMRYVLAISLALAVIAGLIVYYLLLG